MELGAEEFIRRYLLHVLPPRFVRIRYYGLYARSKVRTHLALAQALLGAQAAPSVEGAEAQEASGSGANGSEQGAEQPQGARCMACGVGCLVRQREWHAGERPPVLAQVQTVQTLEAGQRWAA